MAKEAHFSIRLPLTLVIRLDAVAKKTERNRNFLIEKCIEDSLARMELELRESGGTRHLLP